jgi:hypothetical protein
MSLVDRLSSSQDRKDQFPNEILGKEIAKSRDHESIREVRNLLLDPETKLEIKADLLKVLESVGNSAPDLIAREYPLLVSFLHLKKNHLVWRAMCVLSQISSLNRQNIYADLADILQVMDGGSVITRDHGFTILLDLYREQKYQDELGLLIEEQLMRAPDNQLGQYAEKWMKIVTDKDAKKMLRILEDRLADLTNESHIKRISKTILHLNK